MAGSEMIFFDIDGTLVDAHATQSQAWSEAFEEVVGRKVTLGDIDHHGATSYAMLTQLITPKESEPGTVNRLFSAHAEALTGLLANGSLNPLPGVEATLMELSAADVRLGILTGNSPQAAQALLRAARVDRFFETMVCGHDTAERSELVARAVALADGDRPITLVGDTPKDLNAVRDQECRTVAVATGPYSIDELARCSPDLLLADLCPPAARQILRLAAAR